MNILYYMVQKQNSIQPVSYTHLDVYKRQEVESMVEAAKFIDQHSNCDIIDINCGCPVNKVLKANAGSKLLQNPQLIYDIVSLSLIHI